MQKTTSTARKSTRRAVATFDKISEWVAAGNMETGFYALERVERTTEKAIGFKAEKYNEFGNLKQVICWIPRSQLKAVANDFYVNGPAEVFLVPAWLYGTKTSEGFLL